MHALATRVGPRGRRVRRCLALATALVLLAACGSRANDAQVAEALGAGAGGTRLAGGSTAAGQGGSGATGAGGGTAGADVGTATDAAGTAGATRENAPPAEGNGGAAAGRGPRGSIPPGHLSNLPRAP